MLTGTFVMKVAATDADEPDNPNSQVFHTIIDQTPPHDMFYMNSDGSIFIKNKLDREVWTKPHTSFRAM